MAARVLVALAVLFLACSVWAEEEKKDCGAINLSEEVRAPLCIDHYALLAIQYEQCNLFCM
jgi:hypothetical protein